jgi:hypothetical protein
VTGCPADALADGPPDIETIGEALETGPYGRCVYDSRNDVCVNQVVNRWDTGRATSPTMAPHTTLICEVRRAGARRASPLTLTRARSGYVAPFCSSPFYHHAYPSAEPGVGLIQ